MEKQYFQFPIEVKEKTDKDRVLSFKGSTPVRDRIGDEIKADSWDVSNYKKNPVFMWAHDYRGLPIGKAIKVKKADDALYFDIEFAPADVNPKAEQVFQLYKREFLKAVSVGFQPKEHKPLPGREDGPKENDDGTVDDEHIGDEFTKVELLELSAVPVPANPEALLVERTKGLDIPEEVEHELKKWTLKQQEEALATTRALKEKLEGNAPEGYDLDQAVEDTVTKPEGTGWDMESVNNDDHKEMKYRVRSPDGFQDDSFRRITLKKSDPKVYAIVGRPKGKKKTKVQSLRFKKKDWTFKKAKAWVKDHPDLLKFITAYNDETNEGIAEATQLISAIAVSETQPEKEIADKAKPRGRKYIIRKAKKYKIRKE